MSDDPKSSVQLVRSFDGEPPYAEVFEILGLNPGFYTTHANRRLDGGMDISIEPNIVTYVRFTKKELLMIRSQEDLAAELTKRFELAMRNLAVELHKTYAKFLPAEAK